MSDPTDPKPAEPSPPLVGKRKRQKRSLRTFDGPLNQSIPAPSRSGLGAGQSAQDMEEHVLYVRMEKLLLLAQAYGCQDEGAKLWMALAFRLAVDFVPGFSVTGRGAHSYNGQSMPGRPRKDAMEHAEMIVAISLSLQKHKGKIARACKALCAKGAVYEGKQPKTLETIFHNYNSQLNVALAIAQQAISEDPQN